MKEGLQKKNLMGIWFCKACKIHAYNFHEEHVKFDQFIFI